MYRKAIQEGEPIKVDVGLTKEAIKTLKELRKYLQKTFQIKMAEEDLLSFLTWLDFVTMKYENREQ